MSAALHGATPEQLIRRWYARVASYVEKVRQAFPDFHNHIEDTITQGDKAFARLRQTGTHRGAIVGLAPIGVPEVASNAAKFSCPPSLWADGAGVVFRGRSHAPLDLRERHRSALMPGRRPLRHRAQVHDPPDSRHLRDQ